MAELTNLESKLGEVTGLAMAAQAATAKVMRLPGVDEGDLVSHLERMQQEAKETEERCTKLAAGYDGKKTAILDEARATKAKGAEMMKIYLDESSDVLDGFEFLTMCEAGEVGHWSVLGQMGSGDAEVRDLVAWALPIQQGHFETALRDSQAIAGSEDPREPSS